MTLDVLREALRVSERGETPGLATLVATRGSTPQKAGARLLASHGQRLTGTLGGGAVEAAAIREATLAAAWLRRDRRGLHDLLAGTRVIRTR